MQILAKPTYILLCFLWILVTDKKFKKIIFLLIILLINLYFFTAELKQLNIYL